MEGYLRTYVKVDLNAIEHNINEVRKLIDNTDEIDKAYDYINDLLNIAFEEIYFEIGVNDEKKYELILTQ